MEQLPSEGGWLETGEQPERRVQQAAGAKVWWAAPLFLEGRSLVAVILRRVGWRCADRRASPVFDAGIQSSKNLRSNPTLNDVASAAAW